MIPSVSTLFADADADDGPVVPAQRPLSRDCADLAKRIVAARSHASRARALADGSELSRLARVLHLASLGD